jgi:hypothetical protein
MQKSPGTNDGRDLERLVARLKASLLPSGFTVTERERFQGEDGQIAEIDVTIRGQLGGAGEVLGGIECRDRPSEGPAGIPFVRDTWGKQDQLKIQQMLCVSTTGFTPEARRYAESRAIRMATVNSLDSADISASFSVSEVRFRDNRYELGDPELLSIRTADPNFQHLLFLRPHSRMFRRPGEIQARSLHDFLESELNAIFAEVQPEPGGEPKPYIYRMPTPFEILLGDTAVMVLEMRVPLEVQINERIVTPLFIQRYEEQGTPIARTAVFDTDVPEEHVRLTIDAFEKDGVVTHYNLTRKLTYFDGRTLDQFPAGIVIELWG